MTLGRMNGPNDNGPNDDGIVILKRVSFCWRILSEYVIAFYATKRI
jgi:hypothetical protein